MRKTIRFTLLQLILITTAVGALFGLTLWYTTLGECSGRYLWLNPALKCEARPVISKAAYLTFANELREEIRRLTEEGKVQVVGIYFRDLQSGPTFGINDEEEFIPASLLKLPILLTYFKAVEDDPTLLEHTLAGKGFEDEVFMQVIPSAEVIEEGKSYTIEELLWRLIVYSDNRASNLLLTFLDKLAPHNSLAETYVALGLTDPGDDIELETLTVKSYASLFRILYNSSFLSNELSEKALHYLSQVRYEEGLRRGVPGDVPVAHKFGERALPSGVRQLHDCGIVYYPGNPYSLCVMTRGDNFEELAEAVSHFSRMVYEEVDSRRF